jgi:hypothetical protein
MPPVRPTRSIEDWSVLKYGWLAVFLVHVVFLASGVWFIKQALDITDPNPKAIAKLLDLDQRRFELVIQAGYMVTIAFSIILLILAVFVLELFRNQRRMMTRLEEVIAERSGAPPAPGVNVSQGP